MSEILFTANEIVEKVINLEFRTQHLMNATLLRFQEFSESSKFKGECFTWEDFIDWYASQTGKFDYLFTVYGMNFPGEVVLPFLLGRFSPLTDKENCFLNFLTYNLDSIVDHYFIANFKEEDDSRGALMHEIAHGLFHTNKNYKNEVLSIISEVDVSGIIYYLKSKEYHPSVFEDEIQAFIFEGLDWILSKEYHLENIDELRKSSEKIKEVFKKYYIIKNKFIAEIKK